MMFRLKFEQKVQSQNKIQIPSPIRKALNLQPGDPITIELDQMSGHIIIKKKNME